MSTMNMAIIYIAIRWWWPTPRKSQYDLPPTFPLYREEQDHAEGERPAQQAQGSSHHTERRGEKQREMCNKDTDNTHPDQWNYYFF